MRPPGSSQTRRSALTRPRAGDHGPAEVLHLQRVLVVRASDIVAKLVGVLGLDAAARVAAAQADLPTPHAPRTALCEDVVFGAKEQLRDESSADPIVPRGRCRRQRTAPGGTDVLHVVVHVQPGQRCAALGARDVPQVDPGAVGARRAVELPLATKLARRGRQRAEELRLVLSLGVPDEGGSARFAEPLVRAAPVPDARLGLCEQRTPPAGRALAAHALQRADALQFAPKEGVSHSQALPTTLFASGCAWVWNAIFCFTCVLGVVLFFFFGLAFGSTRPCTSERADRAARILLMLRLGGTTAFDVDRCECPLLQRLLGFCRIVTIGAFGANLWCTYAAGLCRCARMAMCFTGIAIGESNHWANSRRSSTMSRHSYISSKRSWLHVSCLFVAGLGSCGASDLAPGEVFSDKSSLVGALSEWCADMTEAEATHGSVSTWDVSLVTDMQYLIYNAPCHSTFDEDVNAWDVGQVTSMHVRRCPLWGMGVA